MGEERTPHSQANLPRLANEKVKSVRGTRHLLRVNPKRPEREPENERQAKIARPNGKAVNLGQTSPAAISTYVTGEAMDTHAWREAYKCLFHGITRCSHPPSSLHR